MSDSKLSFIPKKTFTSSIERKSGSGFFFVTALFILFLSAVSFGGVFLYKNFLNSQNKSLEAQLETAKSQFEISLINEINRTGSQISALKAVLSEHRSVTPFFDLLKNYTLTNVRFSNFSFKIIDGAPSVSLDGSAKSYATIASQAKTLKDNPNIKEVVFSGLSLGTAGTVNFKAKLIVDPSLFVYKVSEASAGVNIEENL